MILSQLLHKSPGFLLCKTGMTHTTSSISLGSENHVRISRGKCFVNYKVYANVPAFITIHLVRFGTSFQSSDTVLDAVFVISYYLFPPWSQVLFQFNHQITMPLYRVINNYLNRSKSRISVPFY